MINFERFSNIFDLTDYFDSEAKCRKAIFDSRWNKKDVVCPFCGQHHCVSRTDGRFHCPGCKANFSVLVGTIFENTKISLRKWFIAMYLISSHKKGISSCQLARDIHVTQKTAWYILHKVRTLYRQYDDVALEGEVEVDEMYLGGRETNKHESKKTLGTQGRSTKTKAPIFGMVARYGEARALVVPDTRAVTLLPIIKQFVADNTHIFTDELSAYSNLEEEGYGHSVIRHGLREYSKAGVTTNTIEGFWAHFKRCIFGTYHFVSKVYLQRYVDESIYRYNTRRMGESGRFSYMFKKAMGTCYYSDVRIMA
ncbi:MAG: IS1595 family transposase [Bacteroidales bacterium]|nr:IS1595 family transposase [Bacteroidales bacterium]